MIIRTTIEGYPAALKQCVDYINDSIKTQMKSRTFRGANEVRNSLVGDVLTGGRSGRMYKVPGTGAMYQASAPGEPPAVRTGAFRASWTVEAQGGGDGCYKADLTSRLTVNGYNLGSLLEHGTSKMAPRPYAKMAVDKSKDQVIQIFKESYSA